MLNVEVKELSKGAYNINYLKGIVEAVNKISETVILEWSTNMPIRVTPECQSHADISLCYYLAPRIENYDEPVTKAEEPKPEAVNAEAEIAVPQPETS